MSFNKSKLLRQAVRTFLEIKLKSVSEQKPIEEDQKEMQMFEFVRMLCVSKSYLKCSHSIDFDLYRLNLHFEEQEHCDDVRISFTSKNYEFSFDNCVCLNYDNAYNLVKFLLPSHVGIYFDSDLSEFERQIKFLELTKGKIGFNLDKNLDFQSAQTLLKTYADRIHELRCDIKHLEADKSLEFPLLGSLFVNSVTTSSQIFHVLRHKVKELEFDQIYDDFIFEDKNLPDLMNETITKLKLSLNEVNCVKIEKLIKYLHNSCLNLEHFDMTAGFSCDEDLEINQVYDQIVAYIRCMENLKASFGSDLISISIKFNVKFDLFEHDNSWINAICKKHEFSNWQFKSDKQALSFFQYRDKLEMNLEDAGCKLEMIVHASTIFYDISNINLKLKWWLNSKNG